MKGGSDQQSMLSRASVGLKAHSPPNPLLPLQMLGAHKTLSSFSEVRAKLSIVLTSVKIGALQAVQHQRTGQLERQIILDPFPHNK